MDSETKQIIEKVLSTGAYRDIYQVMNIFDKEMEATEEDGTQTVS